MVMAELHLTPEQEAEAQALFQRLKAAFEHEAWQWARLLASKDERHRLGRTAFEVRAQVHRLGAQGLETTRQERKKGISGVEDSLSLLPRDRSVRCLWRQTPRELVGPAAVGAPVLPLRRGWSGFLPLGCRAGGDGRGGASSSRSRGRSR